MTHANLCLAGHTHVACQKTRICSPAFCDDACYRYYLLRLGSRLAGYGVRLHAFSLLPDQNLLLVTAATPAGIGKLLHSLNTSYSRYFLLRYGRRGRVWGDDLALTPVPTDALVLDCQKFIERRVVQVLKAAHPGQHPWGSYCGNAFGFGADFITPHRAYRNVMRGGGAHARYRAYLAREFTPAYQAYLAGCLQDGRPLIRGRRAERLRQAHRAPFIPVNPRTEPSPPPVPCGRD